MSESMCSNESSKVKKIIIKILTDEKPKTVRKLVERTSELSKCEKNLIYNIIREMEQEKEIHLGSPRIERILPKTIFEYLLQINYYSIEFWGLILLSTLFFLTVLLINSNSPLYFLRVIMGVSFSIIIPGWSVSNVIFPKLYETIDQIERVLLAIGINIGIMIFGGLILDQIWAIDSLPFVIMLGSLTMVSTIITGIIRILIGRGKITISYLKFKNRLFKKDEIDEQKK